MIYIDVDGVIADFRGWVNLMKPGFDAWDDDDAVHEVMIDNINSVYLGAARLPAFKYFKDIYDWQEDVTFLTAVGSFWPNKELKEQAINNKLAWLKSVGIEPADVIIVDKAKEKIKYCNPGDVLYDDRPSTIKAWSEAGGIGFIVYDPNAGDLVHW